MKAVEFNQVNVRIAENQEEYETLPAHCDAEKGTATFCFELSEEEIREIQQTGQFYLTILTGNKPLQPIGQSTLNPYKK